ncbi:hypothetical protein D9758_014558 [Tetrapyrgos nigripes]|uniref:Uncharacterized protein n=1 Tax=Tetrapyrgos nigripes TaxID=182062 RepID=A0A8H5FKT9_9AGAR|nr:hypothetical protein D9758_014558 [Tetrapyrgos nigripes]
MLLSRSWRKWWLVNRRTAYLGDVQSHLTNRTPGSVAGRGKPNENIKIPSTFTPSNFTATGLAPERLKTDSKSTFTVAIQNIIEFTVMSSQPQQQQQLVWLITGTSTGLGHQLTLAALARGDKVIATARARSIGALDDLKAKGADTLELDVIAPLDTLKDVAQKAVEIYGRVDVVVNNADQDEWSYVWYVVLTVID